MKLDDVIKEVETIRDAMAPILDASSHPVISAVLADLSGQKRKQQSLGKRAVKPPWAVTIGPKAPLTFVGTDEETAVKHNLEVDLACSIVEPDATGTAQGEHNIAVRVWSKDCATYFREALDAETLREPLSVQKKRVMLRFHFDLCNKDQQGPKHHLQIGGKGQTVEYAWMPENWKLPRFAHLPINLVLACEFIGRTFFPKAFSKIAEEPTWKHAVLRAEKAYLLPFLNAIPYLTVNASRHEASFLSWAWNG